MSGGRIRNKSTIETGSKIHLASGKVIGESFRTFTHGYAVTSQSAQGKDAKHVIVSTSLPSKGAISKNQAYVSFSRGKRSISIFTEDIESYRKALRFSGTRRLALDRLVRGGILASRISKLALTYDRAVFTSKDLIERAFIRYSPKKGRKLKTLGNPNKEPSP